MRVAYLTAGAGGIYCGSCMRDNTLVATLKRQGLDVVLIPVYSPIRTDEPDVSENCVLYGGINIFLQQKSALFRHMPRWLSRQLDRPGLLKRAMRNAGGASPETSAPLVLSILRGENGAQRRELDRLIGYLAKLAPQVVHLPNAFFVGLAGRIKRDLGVAVACTLTGEDIYLDKLPSAYQEEARRLIGLGGRDVDAFLSVSRYYTNYAVTSLGIAPERIHQVPLGIRIESDEHSIEDGPSPTTDRPFTLGYMARICHDKGLHVLCEAFALLHAKGRPCRLKIAGYLGEDQRSYFDKIRSRMAERDLEAFVDVVGEVDRAGKIRVLRSLDILSVPTVYREAKGLYVLESLSQGVPVVQPRHGSFPDLIEATGGGLMCEPNDPASLAEGIGQLMNDPALRMELGQAGARAVRTSYTDEMMAARAWEVFEGCYQSSKS
ncbi:MAG: glycosyltransferase family 4 protein [Phycisphaerae bacterium]